MNKRITLHQACALYSLDFALVQEFAEFGLYPTIDLEGETGIHVKYLDRLRDAVSLHEALGINKEGIDVIMELRNRVFKLQDALDDLQHENTKLRLLLGAEEPRILETQGLIIEIFQETT